MNIDLSFPVTDIKTSQFMRAFTGDGTIKGISVVKVTINPPSLGTGADGSTTATVPVSDISDGAAVGDGVFLIPPYDMQEIMYSGAISAANTIEAMFYNTGAGTVDLASSANWIAIIFHRA